MRGASVKLHIDFEMRSRTDLKKIGAWAYAAHESTEILCLAWSIDGAAPQIVTAAQIESAHIPALLWGVLFDTECTVVAHNAAFEYAIYREILVKRFGWPALESPARWSCTLARAAMSNLPISLDACGAALKISAEKDLMGRSVMLKLCKPQADGTFNEDPELYAALYKYCARDVEAEMELDARLPQMPASEKAIWDLDLIINRRGVLMDTELARRAESMVGALTESLNARLFEITGGAVSKASRVAEIKRYLEAQGVKYVTSLDKEAVTELLADATTPAAVREVLNIRRQVGKTSTSKYTAIIAAAGGGRDRRARGLLQYHGASTGRWAGRLVQIHNFPKGCDALEQELIISAIMSNNQGELDRMFGSRAMDALSGALRGTVIAEAGKVLAVADYNTIEPRVLFWLAGDAAALKAYREGADLYVDLARLIFRNPALTKKNARERAVGKFGILGCGYGMGAPRFQAQCATAGLNIDLSLAATAVRAYRDRYQSVTTLWKSVEAAAKQAIRNPGMAVPCAKVFFFLDAKGEFLRCKLPSGRLLRYYKPSIQPGAYGDEVHYQGPGLGGILEGQKTYGGSLVENIVQAIARDILAAAMLRVEAAGFPISFHVHDELVAEVDERDAEDALAEFIQRMCELPAWAQGLPIAAEGYVAERYKK